jgi:long-chain fatty acid transport protein
MRRLVFFIAMGLGLSLPAHLYASGFFTPEVGARAIARGGAYIAGVEDLTAMYLNPGGLSRIKGTNMYLGTHWDVMHTYYRREPYLPAVRNRNPLDIIPFFATSSDFGLEDWTFAFGAYGPNGVTQRYPDNGPQRYSVHEANSVQLYIMGGVGWQPVRWLRLGLEGGISNLAKEDYYGFSILKDRNYKYDIKAQFLAESEFKPMWTTGVILEPVSWFHIGFSYIPRMTGVDLVGTLKADLPEFYAALLGYDEYVDKIKVTIDFPEQYRGGVRFLYRDIFDVEAAFSFIPWSVLTGFPVDLESEELMADFDLPLYWEDSWCWRFGGTYNLGDHFKFHGGYFWENPATPEETMGPGGIEGIRNAFSGGLTMTWFGMDLNFAYAHVFMDDRIVDDVSTESELDDGRGKYKAEFDHIYGSININFEKLYYTFKGGQSSQE